MSEASSSIDSNTKVHVGFALTVIIAIVGATWNLSSQLQGIKLEMAGVRLELSEDYARKADLDELAKELREHEASEGHAVLLERVKQLEKAGSK